jgi:fermentation-respiration switch protein FrsA (DUF1100 family)
MLVALILTGVAVAAVALAGGSALIGLYPFLPRDLGGAPNLDASARRVRIPVDGRDWVDGWFVPGTRPAVVIVLHGYGRTHHRAWRYGAFLNALGFHVFTIDFRSGRYRERKPTTLGHFEMSDAQAALDWVRGEPALAGCRVGLLGESLGGAVGLLLAGGNREIAAVVADCAFASGRQALEDSCERWARVPRWPSATLLRSLAHTLTGCDPHSVDIVKGASLLADRPVFIIHGENDNRFSPDQARELWRAAGSKDTLWIIPGVGHNEGWSKQRDLYEQRVGDFFRRHLLSEGPGLPYSEL